LYYYFTKVNDQQRLSKTTGSLFVRKRNHPYEYAAWLLQTNRNLEPADSSISAALALMFAYGKKANNQGMHI
jgi:hypothetical protein